MISLAPNDMWPAKTASTVRLQCAPIISEAAPYGYIACWRILFAQIHYSSDNMTWRDRGGPADAGAAADHKRHRLQLRSDYRNRNTMGQLITNPADPYFDPLGPVIKPPCTSPRI